MSDSAHVVLSAAVGSLLTVVAIVLHFRLAVRRKVAKVARLVDLAQPHEVARPGGVAARRKGA